MTALREAAAAVMEQLKHGWVEESDPVAQDLKAALAEEAMQRLTDVQQEIMESEINVDKAEPVAWALHTGTRQGIKWNRKVEHGTPLYPPPPQRKPLSGLEVERLLEQVIGSLPAARRLVRAIERAHGIGGSDD